jgi:hypothetical protein
MVAHAEWAAKQRQAQDLKERTKGDSMSKNPDYPVKSNASPIASTGGSGVWGRKSKVVPADSKQALTTATIQSALGQKDPPNAKAARIRPNNEIASVGSEARAKREMTQNPPHKVPPKPVKGFKKPNPGAAKIDIRGAK